MEPFSALFYTMKAVWSEAVLIDHVGKHVVMVGPLDTPKNYIKEEIKKIKVVSPTGFEPVTLRFHKQALVRYFG